MKYIGNWCIHHLVTFQKTFSLFLMAIDELFVEGYRQNLRQFLKSFLFSMNYREKLILELQNLYNKRLRIKL